MHTSELHQLNVPCTGYRSGAKYILKMHIKICIKMHTKKAMLHFDILKVNSITILKSGANVMRLFAFNSVNQAF